MNLKMPPTLDTTRKEVDFNACRSDDDHVSLPRDMFFSLTDSQKSELKKHNHAVRKLNRAKRK